MKRIYADDGRASAPAWFVRGMLILAFPFVVPWVFFESLFKEICRAFKYAYLEVRINLESFKRIWTSAR